MKTPGSLFLTGPMGAGKSTIGRQLSKQLGLPFHDSDHEIEARTGVDIPLIFDLEGEAGFRIRESVVIDELTQLPGSYWPPAVAPFSTPPTASISATEARSSICMPPSSSS